MVPTIPKEQEQMNEYSVKNMSECKLRAALITLRIIYFGVLGMPLAFMLMALIIATFHPMKWIS